MKKMSKVLLLVMCAVLLVAASVMGTVAYLTSEGDLLNEFTVGEVEIKLDEAVVDEDGEAIDAENNRTQEGNKYHLMPGVKYDKDPTVTVLKDSEPCFVRMKVKVTFGKALTDELLATDLSAIFTGYDAKWERVDKTVSDDKKTIEYEFRYSEEVPKNKTEDSKLPALFTEIKIPGEYDKTVMAYFEGMRIAIDAQAVQSASFDDATDAWDTLDNPA